MMQAMARKAQTTTRATATGTAVGTPVPDAWGLVVPGRATVVDDDIVDDDIVVSGDSFIVVTSRTGGCVVVSDGGSDSLGGRVTTVSGFIGSPRRVLMTGDLLGQQPVNWCLFAAFGMPQVPPLHSVTYSCKKTTMSSPWQMPFTMAYRISEATRYNAEWYNRTERGQVRKYSDRGKKSASEKNNAGNAPTSSSALKSFAGMCIMHSSAAPSQGNSTLILVLAS
jgi:hypothetical protein